MLNIIRARILGGWKKSFVAESLFRGKKVIDIGSGRGDFLKFDRENFVGIDVNDEVLELCKKEGLNVKKASVTNIPFADGSFDGANCQQVIEHLSPDVAFIMLKEVSRVIKKGGLVVISTEMVTKRFWNTFSHIKPYPPGAILKLLGEPGQETFEKLTTLSVEQVYYSGVPFKNGVLSLLATLVAHYLGVGRVNYTMILRKR